MDGIRRLRVLAIPDLHAPWVSLHAVLAIYEAISTNDYDVIIQLGDLYDMYCFSRFARSHDLCTPKEEIEEGYVWARTFWENVNKLSPRSRKIQLKGNHCDRLMKRAFERWPEAASIVSRAERSLFSFGGVETIYDSRDGIEIEGVLYLHGYLTQLGQHAKYFLKNVVHGHTHRGGTVFLNLGGRTIGELDCGFCGDQSQAPLQYGPTKTMLWVLGFGEIDEKSMRFVPINPERKPRIILPPPK